MSIGSVEKVLIVKFTDLPKELKEVIREYDAFGNDRVLEYRSELYPYQHDDNQMTWADTLKMEEIRQYWEDQVNTNGYDGDLEKFIKDYGLEFDRWIMDQDVDLNVSRIFIDICW